MTFEEILPGLKAKKKYVRTGWGGAENYVQRGRASPCGVRLLVMSSRQIGWK